MSVALAQIIGNIGKEPETRYTQSGAMNVTFSVAVNRKRGQSENVTWYRVTAWGKLAETMDRLANDGALAKGSRVFVAGDIQQSEFTGNDGQTRSSLEINANTIQLVGSRDGNGSDGRGDYGSGSGASADVDDLPF